MTTPTVSPNHAPTVAALTPFHAAPDAAPVPYAQALTFRRAALECRYLERPWVLQRRDGNGGTPATVAIVEVRSAVDETPAQADILLWLPAVGTRDGAWQDTALTVNLDEMQGNDWMIVSHPDALAAAAAAAAQERAANDAIVIPRTADDAAHRARILRAYGNADAAAALERLGDWLPGGSRMDDGHALAASLDLCGEYEAAVCPTLGWTPRRGVGNSRMRLTAAWQADMDALEQQHAGDALAAVHAALERLGRGGVVNSTIVDHADTHLESHKRPGVNALLESLGMDVIPTDREYGVTVEVTRTVTVRQTVTVYVTASDADAAGESVDSYGIADAVDDDAWELDNVSTTHWDVDDYDVMDVETM